MHVVPTHPCNMHNVLQHATCIMRCIIQHLHNIQMQHAACRARTHRRTQIEVQPPVAISGLGTGLTTSKNLTTTIYAEFTPPTVDLCTCSPVQAGTGTNRRNTHPRTPKIQSLRPLKSQTAWSQALRKLGESLPQMKTWGPSEFSGGQFASR